MIAPNGSLFISPDCLKLKFFFKNPKFVFNKYRYEELDIDDQNDLNYAKAISKYGIKNFKVGKIKIGEKHPPIFLPTLRFLTMI